MNKRDFSQILNCALLSFDGISENEMILQYGLDPKFSNAGTKLCSYLKSIKLKEKNNDLWILQ